ncbi:hypothetical protein DDE82_006838 [Stemphylium lycopersici]|uniref:Uncharacterized protein n=1 Tax=Stemphylium lycopersici TaxID=183478 RepID=A0A364MWS6_STELY|nr:hypothetical protein DDE82_006838 [Stemphylium lycopersici]RAR05877.1 hypothetical protein DDE83_007191 [Stemphylium lycopersici]
MQPKRIVYIVIWRDRPPASA